MSGKAKVMLVDDAAVVRKLVTDALSTDPELEIVGTASGGAMAMENLPLLNPDIVVLDVEMPDMDGLTALAEIRKLYPKLPVIMFSTLTERGATTTLDALSMGANDYVHKPSNVAGVTEAKKKILDELGTKIKVLCGIRNESLRKSLTSMKLIPEARRKLPPPPSIVNPIATTLLKKATPASNPATEPRRLPLASDRLTITTPRTTSAPKKDVPVTIQKKSSSQESVKKANINGLIRTPRKPELIVIGVSTGGPNALQKVIGSLPKNFQIPILIVQHMPPIFTKLLADRLSSLGTITVREAQQGDLVRPGTALLAPGDFHMKVQRSGVDFRVYLNQEAAENSCRPAVDVLFRSAAQELGASVLGVIMTGMGSDGLRGCEQIKERGGQIIVQDEATSVVWGMPGFVSNAGLADSELSLDEIAGEIVKRSGRLSFAN